MVFYVIMILTPIMSVITATSSPPALSSEQKTRVVSRRIGKLALKIGISGALFFLAGELFLRIVFWEGESFIAHRGPIVQRLERDFKFNRFDGPSRGPEPAWVVSVRTVLFGMGFLGEGADTPCCRGSVSSHVIERLSFSNYTTGNHGYSF